MLASDRLRKTEAGHAEIKSRARGLAQRLRTLLILVDGKLTAQAFIDAAARLGAPQDSLQQLLALGLIEVVAMPAATVPLRVPVEEPASDVETTAPMPHQDADGPPDRPVEPDTGAPRRADRGDRADDGAPRDDRNSFARFREAQAFMNKTAVDALGLRAYPFSLKMELCNTLDDLRSMLPEFERIIAAGRTREQASVHSARARELLA